MNSSWPPVLVSDEEYDSSSDSYSSDEWPTGLKQVLGNRPSARDYDEVTFHIPKLIFHRDFKCTVY